MKRLLICLLLVSVLGCGESEQDAARKLAPEPETAKAQLIYEAVAATPESVVGTFAIARSDESSFVMAYRRCTLQDDGVIRMYPGAINGIEGDEYKWHINDAGEVRVIAPFEVKFKATAKGHLILFGDWGEIEYKRAKEIELTTETEKPLADDAEAYYNQGLSYGELDEYDKAIACYTEAIRINPNHAEAYYNRGYLNELTDRHKAIADFTEVIRINPDHAKAYFNRANAYHELDEYDNAIADHTEAIRINPDYVDAFQFRSRLYHGLGKYDKAIADFTEVIRIDPDTTTAYYERGVSYRELGEYGKAIEDFTEAIRIEPDHVDAYYERGVSYHELGKYGKAIADLTKVIVDYTEVYRKNPALFGVFSQAWAKAHYNRGNAYQELGDKDKAASDFARAKELRYDPEDE